MAISEASSVEDVLEFVSNFKFIRYKKHPNLCEWLKSHTAFMDECYDDVKIQSRMWCVKNGIYSQEDLPRCNNLQCNNPVRFLKNGFSLSTACSKKCMATARAVVYRDNVNDKYGVDNTSQLEWVKDKIKESNIEKYGVENVIQVEEFKKKVTDTMIKKYGVSVSFLSKSAMDKTKKSFEKYGGNPMKCEEVKSKRGKKIKELSEKDPTKTISEEASSRASKTRREKRIEKHSERLFVDDREWLYEYYIVKNLSCLDIAKITKTSAQTISNRLKYFDIDARSSIVRSSGENEVYEFVKSIGISATSNIRGIFDGMKELDIYIKTHNMAIEYNGIYWHSAEHLPRSYHKHKQDKCEESGIKLLQIFDDEWKYKRHIVEDRIKTILGVSDRERVFARKTTTSKVSPKEARVIYEQYHIQGSVGATHHYGLYHEDCLVACMSFQDKKQGHWELVRYVTAKDVVGGFSKLLKHFIRNHQTAKVTSFADRRWSDGNVYEKNGFKLVKITDPNYQYVVGDQRVHKQNFRRSKIEAKYNKGELKFFDPALSERENMAVNNIHQIYDAGLIKYELICS